MTRSVFWLRPILAVLLGSMLAWNLAADEAPKPKDDNPLGPLEKATPKNIEELKTIQKQVTAVVEKVLPCTVSLRIGNGNGSGVIVSKDGLILTAGHVSGAANREVMVILQDGKKVKGKTLGANYGIDSGMVKITEEGEWPFVEMGKSEDLKKGQWCICTGHPGGFKQGRPPVVRLGRVLHRDNNVIQTDCTLVGGDSGGPLFDMNGRVIGINSRIGGPIVSNMHVPVGTFEDTWDRLVKGETWGGPSETYLGVQLDPESKNCKITQILPDSPAEKAGLKESDIVTRFNGEKIDRGDDLVKQLSKKKPGEKISLEVIRGEEKKEIDVTLAKRGS